MKKPNASHFYRRDRGDPSCRTMLIGSVSRLDNSRSMISQVAGVRPTFEQIETSLSLERVFSKFSEKV